MVKLVAHGRHVGFHTGTDFARYGYTALPDLYSVCSGAVVRNYWTNVLGWQIVIQEDGTGYYWRYCHMNSQSSLAIGTRVDTTTVVGQMGQTGTGAHGIHLHLEYATALSNTWSPCNAFMNPSNALGIPNVSGTVVHYDGSVPPPPPPPPPPPIPPAYEREKGFPWAVMTHKIRNERNRKNV